METLIACISSAGLTEKRPPHMAWPPCAPPSVLGAGVGTLDMNDTLEGQKAGRSRRGPLAMALWAVAVVVAAAALYVIGHPFLKPPPPKGAAKGCMALLSPAYAGSPMADTPILDANGKTVKLSDLKGRPMVV